VAIAAVAQRLGIARIVREEGPEIVAFDDDAFSRPAPEPRRGYDLVSRIAVIEVEGMLVQKTGTLRPYSGMTGYDGLRANFLTACADQEARAIVLDINSGGGEVSGCFDFVDTIYEARGSKPIWAICSDHAFSAAYAIASACDRITVPRTGGVGSIGVITMLVDYSQALTEAGLAVHFVHCGARKAEESRAQYQGVKPELLKRLQADVDAVGDIFIETVARNRGLKASAVRAQQAACFLGADGVEAGLADAVMAPDAAFAELLAELGEG
jgi:ClpP class serine protease